MTVGVVAIGRPTFDVAFSQELADRAFKRLTGQIDEVFGSPDLAMSHDGVVDAARAWGSEEIDALVVIQASFADSTLVAAAASTTPAPLVLWGAPEPRTGGRLRRNSLCGVNLAGFRLAQLERDYRYVYADPDEPRAAGALDRAIEGPLPPPQPWVRSRPQPPPRPTDRREPLAHTGGPSTNRVRDTDIVERLERTSIGVIGSHPDGFEPCAYDTQDTLRTTGVTVDQISLDRLFDAARAVRPAEVEAITRDLSLRMDLSGLGASSIEPSVRLHAALDQTRLEHDWSAVATRCWPECFTEFGGAACTAQSLLNSTGGFPAMCEADVYGAITSLMLQWSTGSPAFTADLVDIDADADTAVLWHCGLAPFEMADQADQPRGIVHTNRGLPLLNEFALKPGDVTVARLSQSRGQTRLVIGRGEMLQAPRPFSGTAGTIRFSRSVSDVLDTIMIEGLEHHYGMTYGDATDDLIDAASSLAIDVVEL